MVLAGLLVSFIRSRLKPLGRVQNLASPKLAKAVADHDSRQLTFRRIRPVASKPAKFGRSATDISCISIKRSRRSGPCLTRPKVRASRVEPCPCRMKDRMVPFICTIGLERVEAKTMPVNPACSMKCLGASVRERLQPDRSA